MVAWLLSRSVDKVCWSQVDEGLCGRPAGAATSRNGGGGGGQWVHQPYNQPTNTMKIYISRMGGTFITSFGLYRLE